MIEVGTKIGGVLVIEVTHTTPITTKKHTRYIVECLECGSYSVLTYKRLKDRELHGKTRCRACPKTKEGSQRQKRANKSPEELLRLEPYGVTPPEWPVPPLRLKNGEYRR
jgi:hypothetical protein